MKYKVFYHIGDKVQLSTRFASGSLSADSRKVIIEGKSRVEINLTDIVSVHKYILFGSSRMIRVIYNDRVLHIAVYRLNIFGYFVLTNAWRTEHLFEALYNYVNKWTCPRCGAMVDKHSNNCTCGYGAEGANTDCNVRIDNKRGTEKSETEGNVLHDTMKEQSASTPRIFLSHSAVDKPFVRKLTMELKRAGVSVWLDEAELRIGGSLIEELSKAIFFTDLVIAVISRYSVKSNWVQKELSLAMTREIEGRSIVVLPLLIESCDIPLYLRDKIYGDFTDIEQFNIQFVELLKAIIAHTEDPKDSNIGTRDTVLKSQLLNGWSSRKGLVGTSSVGAIVPDKGTEYVGYRYVKEKVDFAHAEMIIGVVICLLGLLVFALGRSNNPSLFVIGSGAMFLISGVQLLHSMDYLRRAFDFDKNLLLLYEEIEDVYLPLGKGFWRRWNLGKRNTRFRRALIHQSLAYLCLYVAMILIISALISVMIFFIE